MIAGGLPRAEAPAAPPAVTSRLYSMLEHNERFVRLRSEGYKVVRRDTDQPKPAGASHRACIVTCMDSRLSTLLPEALDLWDGEAKWIKNAGAVITHPFGGIMRSVVVAIFELNAKEVFVIGHRDCGMAKIHPAGTIDKMMAAGIKPETLATLEYAGIELSRWLRGFNSVEESVAASVRIIRTHPLIPASVPIHGLVVDPVTAQLDVVVDGNKPGSLEAAEAGLAALDAASGGSGAAPATGGHACACCSCEPRDAYATDADTAAAAAAATAGGARTITKAGEQAATPSAASPPLPAASGHSS